MHSTPPPRVFPRSVFGPAAAAHGVALLVRLDVLCRGDGSSTKPNNAQQRPTGRRELHDAQQMLNKSPAYRESNPVAAGGAAAGGTGIVSAVRVAFPAGLQQYEDLGLNVEFPLRIGHFARATITRIQTVPAMKVRSETGGVVW